MTRDSILPFAASLAILLCVWLAAWAFAGQMLVPAPWTVLPVLGELLLLPETWSEIGATLGRSAAGLGLALCTALILGVPAGLNRTAARLCGPLVAALQSCPPVLWISLAMIWCGTGPAVPVAVVFASVFPPLFANTVQGCMALDKRVCAMSRLYRVPRTRRIAQVVLPGITPYLAAGLSYALAAAWKVTAVAEYLASGDGVGARLYWAYRMLEIEELVAWALILTGMGVCLETAIAARMRRIAARRTATAGEAK